MCLIAAANASAQIPLTEAFTYQGVLESSGIPVNQSVDLQFSIFDDPSTGTMLGPVNTKTNVVLTSGVFTVQLDFGPIFTTSARFLEIAVRIPHDPTDTAPFVTLNPRQLLTPTPVASFALEAAIAGDDGDWSIADLNSDGLSDLGSTADGFVAIGSFDIMNVPDNKLHIRSTGTDGIKLEVADGTEASAQVILSAGNEPFVGQGAIYQLNSPSSTIDPNALFALNRTSGPLYLGTNNTIDIAVTPAGEVGIGTLDPAGFLLAVNGDAAKPGGGAWSTFSDRRLKRNIKPMRNVLPQLLSLHGYQFEYTPDAIDAARGLAGTQIGLIADEVEAVFPGWVSQDTDGFRYVTERGVTSLMIEALREFRTEKDHQISSLRQQNADMKRELSDLEDRLKRIEARLGRTSDNTRHAIADSE